MDTADAREEACETGLFVVVFDYKAVLIVKHIFPFLNRTDNCGSVSQRIMNITFLRRRALAHFHTQQTLNSLCLHSSDTAR